MNIALAKGILILGMINIWRHRLRSTLTVLGIVFGVCSVIAMLAIGEGASFEAQEQIRQLGSQNVIVRSVKPPQKENLSAQQSNFVSEYGLTYKDAERIRSTIPGVEVLVPSRSIRAEVFFSRRRADANVIGTVPWYLQVANQKVSEGRFITEADMDRQANVCVLSDPLAKRMFPFENPVGKNLRIKGDYYRVVGIMEGTGMARQNPSSGESLLSLFIPLTTAKGRFGTILVNRSTGSISAEKVELHQLTVKVKELDLVRPVASVIRQILDRTRKQVDYEIVVPLELLRQAERTKRIFNIVLGSIAAISLLVGGIGIMNIMLASVTERTREIGIRRALGARRRDIIVQFLTETVLLSGVGGVIGVGLGLAIPFFITYFAQMQTIIRIWSPVGAFAISLMIGVIFGIYPAYRAAMMNPIAALRHE